MYRDEKGYRVYESDHLKNGRILEMEHSISIEDNSDISELISKSRKSVETMRKQSVKAENAAFKKIKAAFKEWEKCAAVTYLYDRAIEYLTTPEVSHTSNQWREDERGNKIISNKVYKMTYRFFEYSSYRTGDKKRCEVTWWVSTNSPKAGWSLPIAEQKRSFASREEAEKYMQGRIKTYSHLFTEICPVVPEQYTNSFSLHGQPLRGYIIEGMEPEKDAPKSEKAEKKPSIRKQLKQNAEKTAEKPSPVKKHSKDSQEL